MKACCREEINSLGAEEIITLYQSREEGTLGVLQTHNTLQLMTGSGKSLLTSNSCGPNENIILPEDNIPAMIRSIEPV